MKLLIWITFCFSTFVSFGQVNIKGFVGLMQNVNSPLTITETNLNFGVKFNNEYTSVSLFGTYSYGGVFNYNAGFSFQNDFSPFQLDYHLLGGGIKLRMRDVEKEYSPALKFTFLTEITSKYRGGKLLHASNELKDVAFLPTNQIYEIKEPKYGGSGGPMIFQNYRSYHYISTPFVGSFFFGNEFRISDDLNLNIGLGYLLRAFRYFKNEWEFDESEPVVEIASTHRLKKTKYGELETEGYFELELGLIYTFTFNPKP